MTPRRPDAEPVHPPPSSAEPAADAALRRALQRLPSPADPQRDAALQARVLAAWAAGVGGGVDPVSAPVAPAPAPAVSAPGARPRAAAAGAGLALGWLGRGGPRRGWALASAALVLALLVAGLWPRSDPALDELLQPDVLSQMAAGQM